MDLGLTGRRAAVAAASSGLGLASAKALATEGASVAICGRDAERLADAAAIVGHGCVAIVADVGTAGGAEGFVHEAAGALGGIDILVPNGGGPPAGNFAATPVDAYQSALDANLLAVVAMCKAAVPDMQAQGWGRVVAITSLSVRQPMANLILSNTARAGVTGFLKTLALEVASSGVTVNSVQPGLHRTARVEQLYGVDAVSSMAMGDADDFGAIVAFLCGRQARYTTGVQLHVDGGAYAGLL
jgi:3-oxoacyl-[acyl-carrier protein] reductase